MSELDTAKPFTTREALGAGLTAGALRGPAFRRLFDGVFVRSASVVDVELVAKAALRIFPSGAFASHHTAAQLLGVPVPHNPDVHITVPQQQLRRRRPEIRCHVRKPSKRWVIGSIPVTWGPELVCELADYLGLVDLLVVAESLIAKHPVSLTELVDAADASHGRQVRLARRVAQMARAGVEAPTETRLRALLVLAGFPEPVINGPVAHEHGHYRPDLSVPRLKLAIEYDGKQHRTDLDQWDRDIARREWFQRAGWVSVTVVARDLFQRPESIIERVARAWAAQGGAPLQLTEDWRAHFPSA